MIVSGNLRQDRANRSFFSRFFSGIWSRIGSSFWGTLFLIAVGGILAMTPFESFGDESYTFIIRKQEDKQKHRWTLADWLSTRDTMRAQDAWLALHSPSPFEFYISGNYQFNQLMGGANFNAWEASIAMFVTAFGLEARYESSVFNRLQGIFDIRILGNHDQSTNLTLQFGLKNDVYNGVSYRNLLAGVNLTFYIAQFFGLQGQYRHYFPSTPSTLGGSLMGDRFQGGAFIDIKFFRIYGDYFYNNETLYTFSGITVGSRIYF